MSDIVECVARAICAEQAIDPDEVVQSSGRLAWTYKIGQARTAIAAMREPTEEMITAGRQGVEFPKICWGLMIASALGEKQ